jgi:hypothetical protein|tara:strand:- start:838 stop:1059 length:222 start_codon:yes stop_codon:yes gene_type:complete
MRGVNRNNVLPSRSSPRSNTRACLCADTNTYSRKCCQGAMINQGIGNVTGTFNNLAQEDGNLILQEDNSTILT